VTLQGWKSVLEAGWENEGGGGGGWRSRRARLLVGESWERRVAVARPMPEEPPVMRMVLLWREVRVEESIVKVVILMVRFGDEEYR
jgi:hypothetical protein